MARLKALHSKPTRPPSGVRKAQQVARGQTVQQQRIVQPLDPDQFQKEIERRTAEEQAKMAEFKAHEEKMKEY